MENTRQREVQYSLMTATREINFLVQLNNHPERLIATKKGKNAIIVDRKSIRLYGITASGFPIIANGRQSKKQSLAKFVDEWENTLGDWPDISFYDYESVLPLTSKEGNEALSSFQKWNRSKAKNLAFIYQGIFVQKPKITLNGAAFGFLQEHPELWKELGTKYGSEKEPLELLFEAGAVIFKKNTAFIKMDKQIDAAALMWFLAAGDGFFDEVDYLAYAESVRDIQNFKL